MAKRVSVRLTNRHACTGILIPKNKKKVIEIKNLQNVQKFQFLLKINFCMKNKNELILSFDLRKNERIFY